MTDQLTLNQQLLYKLKAFKERLQSLDGTETGMNVIDAFSHFAEASDKEENCTYARKCEQLFMKQMYGDVRRFVHEIHELMAKIDSK